MTLIPPPYIATMLAIPVLYLGAMAEPTMVPSEYYAMSPPPIQENYSWESDSINSPYRTDENERLLTKVGILHRVVSQLLVESEDIDPNITDIINRRFWDLV